MTDLIREYLDRKMTQARREKAINNDMVTLLKMIDIYSKHIHIHEFYGDKECECGRCAADRAVEALLK